jgi:hypothetical protein
VSLIEVLEEITIPTPLTQQPDRSLVPAVFDVVTLWGREKDEQPEEGFGRMALVAPDGETLLEQEYAINLHEFRRFRSAGRILGFPARNSGRYQFRIERRRSKDSPWEQVATLPLWVSIHGQPNNPERNGGAP